MDQSVQDCQRLMQSKSYYHDSGEDTEDEMERQYVIFDNNDCLEDEPSDAEDETTGILKEELEDPIETAMRDMFEEKPHIPLRNIKVERSDDVTIGMEMMVDVKRIVPTEAINNQGLFNANELCNTSQPCLKNSVKNFLKRPPQVVIPASTKKKKTAVKSLSVVKAAARSPVRQTVKPVPQLLPVNSVAKHPLSPKSVTLKIEKNPVKTQIPVKPAPEQKLPGSPKTKVSLKSHEAKLMASPKGKISVPLEPGDKLTSLKKEPPVKLVQDNPKNLPIYEEEAAKKMVPDAKLPPIKTKAKTSSKKMSELKLARSPRIKPLNSVPAAKLLPSPKARVIVESVPMALPSPSPTVQVTVVDKPEKVPSPVVEVTVTDKPRKVKRKAIIVPLVSRKKTRQSVKKSETRQSVKEIKTRQSGKGTEARRSMKETETDASSTEESPMSSREIALLTCVVCAMRCENRRKLVEHVKAHSSDHNSYECPTCKKTFSQQCNLKRHMRIHSKEKPYACPHPFCKKYFSDQGYLTTHLRYHTNTKPYSCKVCRKGFFDRSNYVKHLKSHTGERNYTCMTCKKDGITKSFLQQSDLTRHTRVHTGIRPFQCPHCPRSFTQNTDLTTHMRTHTGERPFVCNNCKKTFANKRYLNSHVRGFVCTREAAKGKSKAIVSDTDTSDSE